MSRLRVGDGRRKCDREPFVTEQHCDRVVSYLEIAEQDGASIVMDGRGVQADGAAGDFWFGPTLIDPTLAVVCVASYDEGLVLTNSGTSGNGTAMFTNDDGGARKFQNEAEAGMNVPIPVPVACYSFSGGKQSLFGDAKAYGAHGFDFFTREKVIISRWLEPSHGGIDLGFPRTQ